MRGEELNTMLFLALTFSKIEMNDIEQIQIANLFEKTFNKIPNLMK